METNKGQSNLHLLEELTKQLTFKSLVINRQNDHIEVSAGEGTFISFGLYKDEYTAIARGFLSKDSEVPPHAHDGKEVIGIIKGSVQISFDEGDNKLYSDHDVVDVCPSKIHSIKALKDTWFWVVTTPPDEGFPDHPYDKR